MPKVALVQMSMGENPVENLEKGIRLMAEAAGNEAEIIVFPEVMLSPFFPQYENRDVSRFLMKIDGPEINRFREETKKLGVVSVPNIYLSEKGTAYDASVVINPDGAIAGVSKMVHIVQTRFFYEQDYYAPSDTGFQVFDTPLGKISVIICFDRHFPESIRTSVLAGAELIVIPTANITGEDLEVFEGEVRVQAYQNGIPIAMCNRVGREDEMDFCGHSLVVDPFGNVLSSASQEETIVYANVDYRENERAREDRPFLKLRNPKAYRTG